MQKTIIFGCVLLALSGAAAFGADDSLWETDDPWSDKEKEMRLLREKFFIQNPGVFYSPDQVPFEYRPLESAREPEKPRLRERERERESGAKAQNSDPKRASIGVG